MEDSLIFAQICLCSVLVIFIVVISFPLYSLILDIKDLIKTSKTLCDTIQNELEPTISELKKTLESVNSLALGVDKNVTAFKSSFSNAYNVAFNAASKIRGASLSLLSGIVSGLKLFLKK